MLKTISTVWKGVLYGFSFIGLICFFGMFFPLFLTFVVTLAILFGCGICWLMAEAKYNSVEY